MKNEWSKLIRKENENSELDHDDQNSILLEPMGLVKISETSGDSFDPWSLKECLRVNEAKVIQIKQKLNIILRNFQESVAEEALKIHFLQASLANQST